MGFWSDFKAKRALKSATKQYQLEYADWQRDVEIFKDIEAAFELAKDNSTKPVEHLDAMRELHKVLAFL